jgi:hypothetical protein
VSPRPGVRERKLWIAVAVAIAALLASLYPLQFLLDFLRARNLLRLSIVTLFAVVAGLVAGWMLKRRAGVREWLVLFLAAAAYALFAMRLEVPQERLHLVEYGALALLLREAFAERRRSHGLPDSPGRVAALALGASIAVGWVDELVQGILPNRQYDLRDVGFNTLAAAMALATAAALESSRRGRQAGGVGGNAA